METQAQEQVGPLPNYGFESNHISMARIGELLERMGREMQQNGSVTLGGTTYPLSGYGGIEFFVNRRGRPDGNLRTGFQMDVGSDGTSDPPAPRPNQDRKAYALFEGPQMRGTVGELADALDEMASELENTGAFSWDIHTGDFAGTAIIDQYLGQNTRNPRMPFRLMVDITFGEGDFQRHDDREDIEEMAEGGQWVWQGTSSADGVDQAGVVEALRAMSMAMRSGQLVVGEGQAELGDSASLGIGHVAAFDGSSEKIEMVLNWPSLPPPEPQPEAQPQPQAAGPRYYEEPTNMPVTELAALLQRIATEILEDGTFMLEGEEVTVGETVGGEISISARGMSVEVGWRR
jgi:hypothetical protein